MNVDRIRENLRGRSGDSIRRVEEKLAMSSALKAIELVMNEKLTAERALNLRKGLANIVSTGGVVLDERVDKQSGEARTS